MSSVSFIATSEKERKRRADACPFLRSLRLDVGGIDIHCLAAGSRGHPVVILHGGGFDAAGLSFRKTIPVLAKRHRVYAPDWPGFGQSNAMPRNWCVEECVEFVAHLLDSLGLKRVTLIGLSMGGAFAVGFALGWPKRVERLVLVDSVGLGGGIPGGLISYFALHLPLVDELRWALLTRVRTLARRTACAPLLDQSGTAIEDALDEIIRLARKPGAGAAFRQLQRSEYRRRGLRTNYLDRLSEIQVPTLIVQGAEDRLIPVACAKRAHYLIPRSQLEIITRCGHLPPVEQPESFNRIISSFLKKSHHQLVFPRLLKKITLNTVPWYTISRHGPRHPKQEETLSQDQPHPRTD
jgi:pimeloyl-ACP methyl ester carboxylesterase